MNLRDSLQSIYDQRGKLTPALVVETAAPADHPLHDRFEWDDSIAGPKYRELQAAELIRSVRVVYDQKPDGEEKHVRAFVAPQAEARPNEYIPTDVALADEFTRQLVLRQFERAVAALRKRYGHLKEYDQILRSHGLGESA